MAKSVTVTLGGRSYEIAALPIRESAAWRRRLAGPFAELTAALQGASGIELTRLGDLAGLVQTLSGTILGSVDLLLELLFAYAPALVLDRERIETSAFDEEALVALVEVLKLAYPFGALTALVSGARKTPTS